MNHFKTIVSTIMVSTTIILASFIVIGDTFYDVPKSAIAQSSSSSSLLSYENPTYGITIQYPSNWMTSTNQLPTYNSIIGFYSPLESLSDVLPVEFALSITTYTNNISLDEYTKITRTALEQQGMEISESSATTLAGNPAHKITFSPGDQIAQNSPVEFKFMQIFTIIGNKVYSLSYNAEASKFSTHLNTIQQMLDSVKIQQPSPPST
ncbi:MAG TPA: PsbP-related protein [Nitrososphaeraceae archaeon]|jgi:PsbP-like protein